jgi:hypothetical protein
MDSTLMPLFKLKLDMAVASYTKKENPVGEVEDYLDGLRQYLHLSGAAGCVQMKNIVGGWPIHHKTCHNTLFYILYYNYTLYKVHYIKEFLAVNIFVYLETLGHGNGGKVWFLT